MILNVDSLAIATVGKNHTPILTLEMQGKEHKYLGTKIECIKMGKVDLSVQRPNDKKRLCFTITQVKLVGDSIELQVNGGSGLIIVSGVYEI